MCIPPDCLSISAGGFIQLACDISYMLQWLMGWHIYISGSFHVLKRGCLTLLLVGLSISSFGGGVSYSSPIPLPPATHSGFSGLHVCLTFLYLCYYAFLPIVALWWAYRVWVGSAREARSWRGEGGGSSWVERDWRSCLNFYCFSYCRYNPLIVLYLE